MSNPSERFKVWITTKVMTQGIFTRMVVPSHVAESMVCGPSTFENYHGEGKDWHRTRESAVKKAEQIKARRIKSLKVMLKKAEALDFTKDTENE